jgi:hypothetical protein
MTENKYCSSKFKCGEDLDAALEAALCAGDCATRAEAAADRAEAATQAVVEVANNLPAPSESLRGRLLLAPNEDTDVLYICMLISGVYKWAEFVPQTNSETNVVYLVDLYGTKLKTSYDMYLSVNV